MMAKSVLGNKMSGVTQGQHMEKFADLKSKMADLELFLYQFCSLSRNPCLINCPVF